jgi:tetratricopeptide (TPR) repeat protein
LALPVSAQAATVAVEGEEDEARALYEQGLGRYETADYLGAIDLWTQAFTLLPNDAEFASVKADIIYNLARARERQYDVDNDPAQLRQALILLDQYIESLPSLYADPGEVDQQRSKAQQVRDDIQARLDEHEKAEATKQVGSPAPAKQDEDKDPGRGLVLTGAALTAIGGAALGVSAAGMVLGNQANDISDLDPADVDGRREQFDRGRTMNLMAISAGVGAGLLIGTGVALLVVGKKKGKESQARVLPFASPTLAGLSASGRF